jgi:hypothetical protein
VIGGCMFSKTVVQKVTETRLVPYEKTVHEHRAPTDESIKLYGEYADRAYDSVLETIRAVSSFGEIEAKIWKDYRTTKIICGFSFNVNGKKLTGKVEVDEYPIKNNHELIKKVYDEVSHEITSILIGSVIKDIDNLP